VSDVPGPPWAVCAEGLLVTVRLTPKGGRDAIEGIVRLADGRAVLKARVAAAANKGEANEALRRILARVLDIAPRDVVLVGGASARVKQLVVRGDPQSAAAKLRALGEVSAT
jgi:uncharacterized protein (TIGR00251 family)